MSSPQTESSPACLVCRQRKVACDRRRPSCGLCSKNSFDCQYKSRQHRPGLRAGYVSRLESQLSNVENRLRRVEAQLQRETHAHPSPITRPDRGSIIFASQLDGRGLDANSWDPATGEAEESRSPTYLDAGDAVSPDPVAPPDALSMRTPDRPLVTWVQKYQPWFPILHPGFLDNGSGSADSRYILPRKAVAAVVVLDQEELPHWERSAAAKVAHDVVLQGLTVSSLQTLQALLIISNHHYASGNLTEFWNILAICKRISLHLGFHDIAAKTLWTRNAGPRKPERLSFNSTIEKEEAIRAFWMIEMLDSISTLGSPDYMSCLAMPPTLRLPCLESAWAEPEPVIDHSAPRRLEYSSSFSLCIILAMEELSAIRQFLGKPYDLSRFDQRLDWQSEAQRLDERLTNWREEFVAAVFRLINTEEGQCPRGEMEPLIVLTNCVLNAAIIVLLQQMAPFPRDIEREVESWAFATTRCVYACENMAAKIRRIGADQLNSQPPHLVFPAFTAARFYVVYCKALDADVPANLHTLAFALHSFGKRWPLARQYETIIRTAVAEHRSPIAQCVLPVEFYDFRYSTLEITDLLQATAESLSRQGAGEC